MITADQFASYLSGSLTQATAMVWEKLHVQLGEAPMQWYWGPDMVRFYLTELEATTGGLAKPCEIRNLGFRGGAGESHAPGWVCNKVVAEILN